MAKIIKKVKTIKVDADKCNGCRGCEIVCSGFHATPIWSSINPARSRIQVITDRLNNKWLPVFAGQYTAAECMGRNKYIIDGKEYEECDFCRASCPSRELFQEPDSILPLKCDMCESIPPLDQPKCVEVCLNDVLTYEEREEEVEEDVKVEDVEIGLASLIDKYGRDKVIDIMARMAEKTKPAA
ncbi:MAG: hypothetical protein KBB67_14710 [Syntrophorhabdus sp.]|jgi:Fe-S-cluster-containing dehydrogenase component|nr:hypothetical protein [Syntrophorhabdus sp.]MDI9558618.1 (4Fe-4S)-binding protein [Pseudomonadota bacterium]